MLKLCGALAAPFLMLLGACNPAQIAATSEQAYQVTVVDAGLYIAENHERRRQIRAAKYNLEDEVIRHCEDLLRATAGAGEIEAALERLEWCFDFLERAYPDLVTIEALREGRAVLDELDAPDVAE